MEIKWMCFLNARSESTCAPCSCHGIHADYVFLEIYKRMNNITKQNGLNWINIIYSAGVEQRKQKKRVSMDLFCLHRERVRHNAYINTSNLWQATGHRDPIVSGELFRPLLVEYMREALGILFILKLIFQSNLLNMGILYTGCFI